MVESIIDWDKSLFLLLNSFHTPFWDHFFLIYTNSKSWYPVILGMITTLYLRFKPKEATIYVLILAASFGMSDFIASGVLKPWFGRLRPCHDILYEMTLVGNRCGGLYGFASSHAANSFALFSGFSLVFKNNKYIFWGLLGWAAIMSYSRVYIGVHYPGDILAGALVGLLVSNLFFYIYFQFKNTKST